MGEETKSKAKTKPKQSKTQNIGNPFILKKKKKRN